MAPNASYLSSAAYGYDYVVAVTQEAINAGMIQYLQVAEQPTMTLCFLVDADGQPTKTCTLDELLVKTENINPFDIPDGTEWSQGNYKINVMMRARFACAIEIRMGIPPGSLQNVPGRGPQIVLPEPVITLGLDNGKVTFNMYCASLRIVVNTPPNGWGPGSWSIFSQPTGTPWYAQTTVDLTTTEIDRSLNTDFFNKRPEWKKQVRDQLDNISASAFSIQQLLVNLDSALMQSVPEFKGITNKSASNILTNQFIYMWSVNAKMSGLPLVGLNAVPRIIDQSPLQLKALERWNSPVVDPTTGGTILSPSKSQLAATTLNYLCSTSSTVVPRPHSFGWNWVEPGAISQSSGVISINRYTLARYIVSQLSEVASKQCPKFTTGCNIDLVGTASYSLQYTGLGQPSTVYQPSGNLVASMSFVNPGESSAKASEAAHCSFNVRTEYSCDILFGGTGPGNNGSSFPLESFSTLTQNTIIVAQSAKVHVYMSWNANNQGCYVVRKTIIDSYEVSVGRDGKLSMTPGKPLIMDSPESPNTSDPIIPIGDRINTMKDMINRFDPSDLSARQLDQLGRFIFPGAMVFTYSSATFSDHQDLTSLITYVKPTRNQLGNPDSIVRRVNVAAMAPSHIEAVVSGINQIRIASSLPTLLHAVPSTSGKILPLTKMRTTANTGLSTGQDLKVLCTSDIIQNYIQAELVGDQGEFEALQTSDGHSLLFATSTVGVLSVFEESSGQSQSGWSIYDISYPVTSQLPGGSSVAKFAVGQSIMDAGSIGIAMAVRNNGSETLYLSLQNSSVDTRWIASPNWIQYPFDAQPARKTVIISAIHFSETDQKMQYIIVDLVRDPTSNIKLIDRFVIDPSASTGSKWLPRALPFEVEDGKYQSCTGRSSDSMVDVIYTGGSVNGQSQLAYVPFFNLSGDAAPMATPLTIPNGIPPSAIAAARNGDKDSPLYGQSDLYAIADYTLYRWAADNQMDARTPGISTVVSATITGTDCLIAVQQNGVTTLFGRNSSDEVWYTSCASSKINSPGAWTLPLPILSGIEKIAAFVNVRDGSNTIFAAGVGKISRIVQSTMSTGKLWLPQEIHVASPPTLPSRSFKSYTTLVKITGSDSRTVGEITIQVAASMRVPVYIHGLYYVLSSIPIHVKTDLQGQLNIVQTTESLISPLLTLKVGNVVTTFDPAAGSWNKLVQIKDIDHLRSATLVSSTVGGGISGTTNQKQLIASNTSDQDAQAVVDAIQGLATAYSKVSPNVSVSAESHPSRVAVAHVHAVAGTVSLNGVLSSLGDLFASVKSGLGKFIQILKDAATGAWHFVCEIAGKVYRAILDSTQAILGALEWVFDKVKTAIMDVIRYLEFLFVWDDIRRCKNVLHNVIKLYMLDMVGEVKTFQGTLDNMFDAAQLTIATWAGKSDWNTLGDFASKQVADNASDPSANQTPGSQLFMNHYKNQADKMTVKGQEPTVDLLSNLITDLLNAVETEGDVLNKTFERLKSLATDFHSFSLTDVLKRIAGIVTEAALGSTKTVLHALLQVIFSAGGAAVGILDLEIHIPIISDILNAIGIPDISFLDLITWIAAVSYTVVYKIAHDVAPFPDNHVSNAVVNAKDWSSLMQAMEAPPVMIIANAHKANDTNIIATNGLVPDNVAGPLWKAGHGTSSLLQSCCNWVFVSEAMDETASGPFGIPKTVISIIVALSSGAVDALVGNYPLRQTELVAINRITLVTTILSAALFSGFVQGRLAATRPASEQIPEGRKFGSFVNVALIIPALAASSYHFYELSQLPTSDKRSAAILGECATLMTYFSRVSYCVTLQDDDPETRIIPALLMAAFNAGYAGLQFGETVVG